jgi:hypothetical protein
MEEEEAQLIRQARRSFNMDGILQSLGGFAKNTAGRYIGSQALGGAGGMLFGPIGGLVGGIIGGLKGGDLFNSTYSQCIDINPGNTYECLMEMECYKDRYEFILFHGFRIIYNKYANMIEQDKRFI